MTGAPVVCTDVGASRRVLTDPETNECFSSIVAPNDPYALAKAQISMLAMVGEWAPYADAEPAFINHIPKLEESPTAEDVDLMSKRMYTQTPARRRLGMRGHEIVQKSFSGGRYLREHEQMLWIGQMKKNARLAGNGSILPAKERKATQMPLHNQVSRDGLADQFNDPEAAAFSRLLTAAKNKSGSQPESLPSLGFETSANEMSVFTPRTSAKRDSMPSSMAFTPSVNQMSVSTGVVSDAVRTNLNPNVKRPFVAETVWLQRPKLAFINT